MASMADLWLPGDLGAQYMKQGVTAEHAPVAAAKALEFRKALKQVDERLDIIWGAGDAFPVPERFYIVRRNDFGPPTVWLIDDGDNGYSDPEVRHLERLQEVDTWAHPDVWQRWQRKKADEKRARELRGEALHEEFREKLTDRLGHIFDTRVSMAGSATDVDSAVKAKPQAKSKKGKSKRRLRNQRRGLRLNHRGD